MFEQTKRLNLGGFFIKVLFFLVEVESISHRPKKKLCIDETS